MDFKSYYETSVISWTDVGKSQPLRNLEWSLKPLYTVKVVERIDWVSSKNKQDSQTSLVNGSSVIILITTIILWIA